MPRRSRPLIGRNTAASRRYRNAIAIETPLQSETRRALRRLRYSEARVAAAKTMQVPVQRIQLWTHKPFSGLQYNTHIYYTADSSVDIGQMSRVCQFCSALRFRDEPFGLCCKQGRVSLLAIESPPEPIFSLLSGLHPLSKSFLLHIRRYNSIFQMTSFGARQVVTLCRLSPRLHGSGDIEVRLASGNTGPRGPKISQGCRAHAKREEKKKNETAWCARSKREMLVSRSQAAAYRRSTSWNDIYK
ncbi:hypothetical protein LAZ67_15000311 [Cordylochernes scorpioides]|uniref:Uncharacterized protein n=1 Tax=Cordylochernes scorpioides TaxID=51811 RepID=A0ABY6L8B2_9ARAC|nr:hypothetical protein LAZ67_15000311 [Cordylochernes scorpioides]